MPRMLATPNDAWLNAGLRRVTNRGRFMGKQNVICAAKSATPKPRRVAIIGAGVSGLVCAKECRNKGHSVRIFEQSGSTGGTWVVDAVPQDLQNMNVLKNGWKRGSVRVHSSMYDNLRTNLPREIMGFTDFPFDQNFPGSEDPRRFCGHQEVRRYLEAYKREFDLDPLIQLDTTVMRVEPVEGSESIWDVETERDGSREVHQFDAVAVCNGHYTVPHVPTIKGLEHFRKPLLHSHLYRNTQPFVNKTVAVLGNGNSGKDIVQEIGDVARKVFFSGRSWPSDVDLSKPIGPRKNVQRVKAITSCSTDGSLNLQVDWTQLPEVDVLILCTGYRFDFPFLESSGLVSTERHGIVYPLYKYLIHPVYPTLFFLGLPMHVLPCVLSEYQSILFAKALSGRVTLPSYKEMMIEIDSSLAAYEEKHGSLEACWRIGSTFFEHMDDLASLANIDPLPEWRSALRTAGRELKQLYPDSYRDQELDGDFLDQARREFASVWDSKRTLSPTVSSVKN